MTNLSKLTWKSIIPSCYKGTSHNSRVQDRSTKPVSNQSSFKRLSLSDFSNSDSPLMSADDLSNSFIGSKLHVFTFAELREITNNFNSINLLGEGGFGPVYKGFVDDKFKPRLKAQPVAVKLLDLDGMQGHKEWMAEIIFLGQLRHPHLVKLIGYCWEGEHRLLVYEYMARGSLENQLFRRYSIPMPWSTRMKIAAGAAKGLAFLHEGDKPVIFRDFKASNILLDSDYTAKVSDFGLAKDGPEGNDTHVSTRIMGTHGYAAPEYIMTGHLTTMSDVYSFGVVLLELITGKRSMDKNRPHREQCLVEWARPLLRDPRKLDHVMDPRLDGQFPTKDARKVTALAYKCLSHYARSRPTMIDVVKILETIQEFDDSLELVSPIVYIVPNSVADDKGKGDKGKERNGKIEDDGKLSNCHGWRRRIKLPLPRAAYGNINIVGNSLSHEKRSSEQKLLVKQSSKVM